MKHERAAAQGRRLARRAPAPWRQRIPLCSRSGTPRFSACVACPCGRRVCSDWWVATRPSLIRSRRKLGERVRLDSPVTHIEQGTKRRPPHVSPPSRRRVVHHEADYLVSAMSAVQVATGRHDACPLGRREGVRGHTTCRTTSTLASSSRQRRGSGERDGVSPNMEIGEWTCCSTSGAAATSSRPPRGLIVGTAGPGATTDAAAAPPAYRKHYPGAPRPRSRRRTSWTWANHPWASACETTAYPPGRAGTLLAGAERAPRPRALRRRLRRQPQLGHGSRNAIGAPRGRGHSRRSGDASHGPCSHVNAQFDVFIDAKVLDPCYILFFNRVGLGLHGKRNSSARQELISHDGQSRILAATVSRDGAPRCHRRSWRQSFNGAITGVVKYSSAASSPRGGHAAQRRHQRWSAPRSRTRRATMRSVIWRQPATRCSHHGWLPDRVAARHRRHAGRSPCRCGPPAGGAPETRRGRWRVVGAQHDRPQEHGIAPETLGKLPLMFDTGPRAAATFAVLMPGVSTGAANAFDARSTAAYSRATRPSWMASACSRDS